MSVYIKREGRLMEPEQVVSFRDRIAALERALEEEMALNMEMQLENAALWEFVQAEDAFNALMDSGDWDGDDAAYHAMLGARDALRQYEDTP
jgi:hypothetical protein